MTHFPDSRSAATAPFPFPEGENESGSMGWILDVGRA